MIISSTQRRRSVGVPYHRLANLCCASQARMVMQGNDTRIILVRAECPYVQFELSCSCTWFVLMGYKRTREGNELPSLWVAWAWVWVCKRSIPHSGGCPLPFIVQGREGLTQKVKREKMRGSDAARPLFSVRRTQRVVWALLMAMAGCSCPIPGLMLIVVNGYGGGALLMVHRWWRRYL